MKAGDWVCVRDARRPNAAKVERPLTGVIGGWVLDRKVEGFVFWNEGDLRRATTAEIAAAQEATT